MEAVYFGIVSGIVMHSWLSIISKIMNITIRMINLILLCITVF